ncbi:hypothetical protein AE372_004161 [Salmonella enterica subsp. enterica serovar Colindale]|nr:hypothetical protein [Salmonella enterica subsp. enterica serovar Colindale]
MSNENLIKNGHFDDGLEYWDENYGDGIYVESNSEIGNYAMIGPNKIATQPVSSELYQNVEIESGTDYVLSFQSADVAQSSRVTIYGTNSTTYGVTKLWQAYVTYNPESGVWSGQTENFNIITEGYYDVNLRFIPQTLGTMSITDVVLTKA